MENIVNFQHENVLYVLTVIVMPVVFLHVFQILKLLQTLPQRCYNKSRVSTRRFVLLAFILKFCHSEAD